MAKARAGDIRQIIIYDREFDPKVGGAVTYRLAGYENETEATGNGGEHTTQTRKLGGFEAAEISLDPTNGDLEFLQEKANTGEPGNCSMTLVNGTTYAGNLTLQGAIDAATDSGSAEIAALGAKFEQI